MKKKLFFLVPLYLLIGCSSEDTMFSGTWQSLENPSQEIVLRKITSDTYDITFKNIDYPNQKNISIESETNSDLVLRSNNNDISMTAHKKTDSEITIYLANNKNEATGETPPLIFKKSK